MTPHPRISVRLTVTPLRPAAEFADTQPISATTSPDEPKPASEHEVVSVVNGDQEALASPTDVDPDDLDRQPAGLSGLVASCLPWCGLGLALLLLVVALPDRDEQSASHRTPPTPPVALAARPITALAGVGMPATGPGDIPPKPLTVIVNVTGPAGTSEASDEIARLGRWLSVHHGRARLALITGRSATELVEPSRIGATATAQPIQSPARFTRETFTGRAGQRLLVTIGVPQPTRPPGAALLWLPERHGAPVVDVVALRDYDAITQRVDARRKGVVAATVARAVISLARLREVRP